MRQRSDTFLTTFHTRRAIPKQVVIAPGQKWATSDLHQRCDRISFALYFVWVDFGKRVSFGRFHISCGGRVTWEQNCFKANELIVRGEVEIPYKSITHKTWLFSETVIHETLGEDTINMYLSLVTVEAKISSEVAPNEWIIFILHLLSLLLLLTKETSKS